MYMRSGGFRPIILMKKLSRYKTSGSKYGKYRYYFNITRDVLFGSLPTHITDYTLIIKTEYGEVKARVKVKERRSGYGYAYILIGDELDMLVESGVLKPGRHYIIALSPYV